MPAKQKYCCDDAAEAYKLGAARIIPLLQRRAAPGTAPAGRPALLPYDTGDGGLRSGN